MSEKKSVFGLSENVASALAYAGVVFTGLAFYILEKDNKTVRFHSLQSFIFFMFIWVLQFILGIIPFFGGILTSALGLISLAAWVYLMYSAYKGIEVRIPVIGDIVYEKVNE